MVMTQMFLSAVFLDLSQTHTRLVGDHTQSQHGRQRSTQTLWNILSDRHVQNLPMRDETTAAHLELVHTRRVTHYKKVLQDLSLRRLVSLLSSFMENHGRLTFVLILDHYIGPHHLPAYATNPRFLVRGRVSNQIEHTVGSVNTKGVLLPSD